MNIKQILWALAWIIGVGGTLYFIVTKGTEISGALRVFSDLILLPLFFVELAIVGLWGYEKLERK